MNNPKIYIHTATRSPIGKFGGQFRKMSAVDLASKTLTSCFNNSPVDNPDFIFLGHARQAGCGPNPARQAAIKAGISEKVPAMTINHACASGISSVIAGIEKICSGNANHVFAGGVESMSNTPYLIKNARWGSKLGNQKLQDGMYEDGFFCQLAKDTMGSLVEKFLVKKYSISRNEQDEYAYNSQQKFKKAIEENKIQQEYLSSEFENIDDECPRTVSTIEKLNKLQPVFDKNGTITAGNSSAIADGSAWIDLSSSKNQGCLAEIIDFETTSLDPNFFGIGPVQSCKNLMKRNSLAWTDIKVLELNEAFAAQAIACQKELGFPETILNPLGGAISIGHPIGATGTRILVSLTHQLQNFPGGYGIASLCVSGGQGVSMLLKSMN